MKSTADDRNIAGSFVIIGFVEESGGGGGGGGGKAARIPPRRPHPRSPSVLYKILCLFNQLFFLYILLNSLYIISTAQCAAVVARDNDAIN